MSGRYLLQGILVLPDGRKGQLVGAHQDEAAGVDRIGPPGAGHHCRETGRLDTRTQAPQDPARRQRPLKTQPDD